MPTDGFHNGRAEDTAGRSIHAKPLDPDVHPWERQPNEGSSAWEAFKAYRDSEHRKVTEHGPNALTWSSHWSWGHRAFEFDRYMDRVEVDAMAR